jgi:hypothetical protein
MQSARFWIDKLALQKHPEGGWFKEVYRSEDIAAANALPEGFNGQRNYSTSIYYLLETTDFSSFHKIKSDEIWHYYAGSSAVEILWIEDGKLISRELGNSVENNNEFQVVVPKNRWFAARLLNTNGYALVGCTVSPGFHFDDFELADKSLLEEFPELKGEIERLVRKD